MCVFLQFLKKGLDVVIQMDVFQHPDTLHAIPLFADMLQQCSDQQLYLPSDILSQSFPAETNKVGKAFNQLPTPTLIQHFLSQNLFQSLALYFCWGKPYQITSQIFKQGNFRCVFMRQFMKGGLLGVFSTVRFELRARRAPEQRICSYKLYIVGYLIQIRSGEATLRHIELSLSLSLHPSSTVHRCERFSGSASLVFRFWLDDLSWWLSLIFLTLPSCFCLTWVKSAAQLQYPLPQGQKNSRILSASWGLSIGNIIWIFINSKYINNYMLNYQKIHKGRFASPATASPGAAPTYPQDIFGPKGLGLKVGGNCHEWPVMLWIGLFVVILTSFS